MDLIEILSYQLIYFSLLVIISLFARALICRVKLEENIPWKGIFLGCLMIYTFTVISRMDILDSNRSENYHKLDNELWNLKHDLRKQGFDV